MAATIREQIAGLYVLFFDRAPDASGLAFWEEQAAGADDATALFGLSTAFAQDAAFRAEFTSGMSNTDFVNTVYQNALARDADTEGLAFWESRLEDLTAEAAGVQDVIDGTITAEDYAQAHMMAEFVGAVLNYEGTDTDALTSQATFQNKVDAGIYYADTLGDTSDVPLNEDGSVDTSSEAYQNSINVLADVTDDPATVDASKAESDALLPVTFKVSGAETDSIDEGQTLTFTIEADSPVVEDTIFTYETASTSAAPEDFTGDTAGSVTINAGESSVSFSIAITADNVAELTESFTVTVKDSSGAEVGEPTTYTINDVVVDDVAPTITAEAASYAENSAAGTVVATVTADETVTFSVTSDDFAIDAATGEVTLTDTGAASSANDFEADPNETTLTITATDEAGNTSTADLVLTETNVDDDAPTVSTATVGGTKLVIEFNEALDTTSIPAGSTFTVTETTTGGAVTNKTLSSTDPVSINNSSVILSLATGIATDSTVTVSYTPSGTNDLKDLAGNAAEAVTAQSVTLDGSAPTLSSSTPADDATDVVATDDLTLTFSESVISGTGNIVITNSSNSADTRTIDITDTSQITINGATVTINPTADLTAGANYNITMASGVLTDTIGNAFAGISSSGTLNFTVASSTSSTTGNTFTLTQGTDTIPGSVDNSGDDTINAFLDSGAATFSNLDTVDGGTGTDTFTALGLTGSSDTIVDLSKVTNVEKFVFGATTGTTNTLTFDMNQVSGEQSVSLTNTASLAADLTTVNNIMMGSSAFDIGVSGDQATTSVSTFNFTGTTGTTDAVNLDLNTVIGTVNVDNTANGIETLNIIGSGGKSTLAALGIGTGVSKVTFAGSAYVNTSATNFGTTVVTIDGSQSTGGFAAQQSSAMNLNITGGSGDDLIRVGDANANLNNQDVLDGGAGTDTLSVTTAIASAATTSGVTNFEVLNSEAALTHDMSFFPGNDMAVGAAGNTAGAVIFNNAANNVTLSNLTTGNTIDVNLATDTSADVLNIQLNNSTSAGLAAASFGINPQFETINITSNGTSANTITAFTGTNTTSGNVNIDGAAPVTLSNTAGPSSIDASSLSGAITVTTTGTATQTITGTALGDTISNVGDIANGSTLTINAGGGNDTVTSLAGAVTAGGIVVFNGQDGNDTVSGTSGTAGVIVKLDGGAGNDFLTLTANASHTIISDVTTAANADVITGFATATDSIDYNGALSNGTTTSGISATLLASAASTTTAEALATSLGNQPNATVYLLEQALVGASVTSLANLATNTTASSVSSLYDLFEADLVSELGVITNLDTNLSSTDQVLVKFDSGAHSVLVRVTNTDTTVANTLTTSEIDLVGVFNNTTGANSIVAADFI